MPVILHVLGNSQCLPFYRSISVLNSLFCSNIWWLSVNWMEVCSSMFVLCGRAWNCDARTHQCTIPVCHMHSSNKQGMGKEDGLTHTHFVYLYSALWALCSSSMVTCVSFPALASGLREMSWDKPMMQVAREGGAAGQHYTHKHCIAVMHMDCCLD